MLSADRGRLLQATGNAASGAVPGAFTVEPHFGYLNTATMVSLQTACQIWSL